MGNVLNSDSVFRVLVIILKIYEKSFFILTEVHQKCIYLSNEIVPLYDRYIVFDGLLDVIRKHLAVEMFIW